MPKRNLIWIVIILAMAAVLLLVWHQPVSEPSGDASDFVAAEGAYDLIRENYYKPLSEADLQQAAVAGMADSLDEFTTYVPPGKVKALTGRVMGQACGTGLVVMRGRMYPVSTQPVHGKLIGGVPGFPGSPSKTFAKEFVVAVLPNSPANKAGIGRDWQLLAIDDDDISEWDIDQIRKRLNGPEGKEVKLLLKPTSRTSEYDKVQSASEKTREITLTCQNFPVETVQGLFRDLTGRWVYRLPSQEGIFYIRITEFCPETPGELRKALRLIAANAHHNRTKREQQPHPATGPAAEPDTINGGLILDLRGNPGGVLQDAVLIADMFLADGNIVTVTGRGGKMESYKAHKDSPYERIPLVVLVDENTVSAAELLAGSLAANARAVLVGNRTRGKGCVQTMFKLPNGLGQINLTTAEFFVDPDKPISRRKDQCDWGVSPEIEVSISPELQAKLQEARDRMTLLPPPEDPLAGCVRPWKQRWWEHAEFLCHDDPQVANAVELLVFQDRYDKIIRRLQAEQTQRENERATTEPENINRPESQKDD